MTAALDAAQRTALSHLIQRARSLLELDLASTLEGDFGIHRSDGRIEETGALSLDVSQAAVRIDLLDIVAYLCNDGESEASAVERLVREAAFTHVNRLVALRVAEGLRILPEAIGNGLASQGFRDLAEIAPASADEEWERFRLFVRICADELSADVPALFDPRNPLIELEPSTAAFSELIELFVAADETIWAAPDTLGWSYQFFNTAEERKEMRESSAPRNSRELAVRNQFFTPSYVVEFLVQNGLGAHLAASFPALADEMPLLVEVPEHRPEPIDVREVSALDPACGSGHFLLGAYDVLEAAWRHAGVQPEDAAPDIVRSLWGIDIDPRATQIAQAAVILRARRHCRAPLPKPNVICARSLPAGPETDALIATLPQHVGRVVQAIADELVMAPVLGPLLKIEHLLDREARDAFGTGQIEGTLSEGLSEDDAANVESLVLEALATIADQTTSTASQRLFAAEAHDAVRFVEAMSRRYTACLMNPPFGSPVATTKVYLKAAYPWIPATSNLFALFVGRGMELASFNGTTAAITSRAGLFLSSFVDWRADVLYANELQVVADLGERVMDEAMVEAAAYVMHRNSLGGLPRQPVVIRAVTSDDRSTTLRATVKAVRRNAAHELVYRPDPLVLSSLVGQPFAYWITAEIVSELTTHQPFEPGAGVVRTGLSTGDNFRFVRCWWEVSEQKSTADRAHTGGAVTSTQLMQGCRWVPIIMSGSSQPWFSPVLLVVDWERDGERLRSFVDASGKLRSRPQNTDLYFRPGFNWTRRAPRLVPYVVPAGCIPSASRYQAFPSGDPFPAIALAASNVASSYLRFYGEDFLRPNFLVGNMKSLPVPAVNNDLRSDLADFVEAQVSARRMIYEGLEPFREFVRPIKSPSELAWNPFSLLGSELDRKVAEAYGLDEDSASLLGVDLQEALTVPATRGGSEANDDEDADGSSGEWGDRLVSYLVGLAFGRWDVRIGRDPSLAPPLGGPFDAPPRVPPGALVDDRGVMACSAPADYPIELPPDGVLLDQPGHALNLSDLVVLAALAMGVAEGALAEAVRNVMKNASLSRYLRRRFFSSHLSTYTKGRRRVPIYWQLQVPSKKWGVWLYMPRLSREMLFAVVRETEQRQRLAEQRIATLQREYDDGGACRTLAAVSKELDAEQQLSVELVTFRDEAERIANLGWEPDLDDGAVLNAAPLASLFPAWKDAAKYRNELKQGKYTWSTVSKYADQL